MPRRAGRVCVRGVRWREAEDRPVWRCRSCRKHMDVVRADGEKIGGSSAFEQVDHAPAWSDPRKDVDVAKPHVGVEQEGSQSPSGQGDGKIDGDRGFPNAHFSARDGNGFETPPTLCEFRADRAGRLACEKNPMVNPAQHLDFQVIETGVLHPVVALSQKFFSGLQRREA